MFYNTNTNELLNECPDNGYLPFKEIDAEGNETTRMVLVQGLLGADFETKKSCGILPVKSDTPAKPENSYEDISQRNVVVEDDGVVVTRVYAPNPESPPTVPQTVTARQIRLWLIDNDISLTSVEAAIDTIVNEKLREKTRVEWEFAPYVERSHPLIESLAQYLGLNSSQIDQGFIEASQL